MDKGMKGEVGVVTVCEWVLEMKAEVGVVCLLVWNKSCQHQPVVKYIQTHPCTFADTHRHRHRHTHTQTHTQTHTHTHTYMHMNMLALTHTVNGEHCITLYIRFNQ